MNHPEAFRALDETSFVEDVGGVPMLVSHAPIKPGDLYAAKRNTGWHILTCHKVDLGLGCVHPVEAEYSYDFHECLRIESMEPATRAESGDVPGLWPDVCPYCLYQPATNPCQDCGQSR